MPAVDAGPPLIGARRHTLLVAEDDRQRRTSAAAWVERALSVGEKVFYKGWHDPAAPSDRHWLAGPDGPRAAPEAFRSGQLELANYADVLSAAGWTNEGVRKFHTEEIERAFDEGWSSVAMAHETVKREMADENEAVEVAEHEAGYDVLMERWPLRVLCQLTVAEENATATWETVAMHHRDLVDGPWSAGSHDGLWQPRGEIDAYVARRFGAATVGAMRLAHDHADGPHLHVDLSAVEFIDVAAVQMLLLAARSAPRGQGVVLHHTPRMVERLVEAVGRPDTVRYGSGR